MKPASITIYFVAWNEADIIQQVHKYYSNRTVDANFVLYDNKSTDGTPEIARKLGFKVFEFDTKGKMDDRTHMEIKNSCWKDCKTDWAIVSDMDEVLDINVYSLDRYKFNIVKCQGYEMFGNSDMISECKYGCKSEGYSKTALFKPSEFSEINFGAGAHTCSPVAKPEHEIIWGTESVPLYHFKWSNPRRALDRAHTLSQKQSDNNKAMNWSFHYGLPDDIHIKYYIDGIMNSKRVR